MKPQRKKIFRNFCIWKEILEASRIPMEQREAARKMGSRFAKTIGCENGKANHSFYGLNINKKQEPQEIHLDADVRTGQ